MLSQDLFDFLTELKANNTREWFAQNKERYEEGVRGPLLSFTENFAPHLEAISPYFLAIAKKSGGSLFRIHRDVRFSKDKSPYKTQAALHFRHENGKDVHCPGFYLHLDPSECFCGAGIWRPDSASLKQIREAIVESPKEWMKISASDVFTLSGDALKRAPRGFDPDHPLIEDLKRKDFVATIELRPKDVLKKNFLSSYTKACQEFSPLVQFLSKALDQPF